MDRTIQTRVKRQMSAHKKSITSTKRSRLSKKNWPREKSEWDELKKKLIPPECPKKSTTRLFKN